MEAPDLTVYHDGSCPLCRIEIEHYRRQAGGDRIAFADVARSETDVGADLDRARAMSRFHVRLPSGELKSGAAAFVAVWERLPRWRLAARLAHLPGAMTVLEAGYRIFLPMRPGLAHIVRRIGLGAERR